ncbi:NAD(P)H dehydrogenase (quinone) [Succinivibrio dextrinosolvens]|uniref:NAD(P)H-dependent oxidoreductase n=1 Tax=Succinivibrio dextrinosolvens TaxID=83771 RepID=UPI0008E6EF65|nr:NAD(P)H-dependent oxidoreductase [Succinivibrio dextrinosolvens]SFS84311.1 NAD(P)H dehydrogenase (quinone) [Succinivibrio dextrinosolvens]
MNKVILISGHPDLKNSLSNRTILEELKRLSPEVEIRKLDELYPNYKIDVQTEQKALLDADLIIWQFPMFWYGIPALLKKWLEDVFAHGFAHGSQGTALKGKMLLISLTTGAPLSNYEHGSAFSHTIEEFLIPYEEAANLCKMEYLRPVYSGGMMFIPGVSSEESKELIIEKAKDHAQRLHEVIKSL